MGRKGMGFEVCPFATIEGTPVFASREGRERFPRHRRLLVGQGWRSLEWSMGSHQRISIVREHHAHNRCKLSAAEFELSSTVAVGLGLKQVAFELGVEWTTARTTVSRALRKLGLRSSAQLPAFWHGLSGEFSALSIGDQSELLVFESRLDDHGHAARLTSAEQDVLRAVLVGRNNREIAIERDTSVRTVANQLATLFQKFGASSKAELAAKALQLHAASEPSEASHSTPVE